MQERLCLREVPLPDMKDEASGDSVLEAAAHDEAGQDADAQGVLRSALWAQPGSDRYVTWTTATEGAQRFVFRGGLIMISNRPLADLPELRRIEPRLRMRKFPPSNRMPIVPETTHPRKRLSK